MQSLFEEVAAATSLREGPSGAERFFWTVAQGFAATSREVAAHTGIPIPVVAALRREFEKNGLLIRRRGMLLSSRGAELACRLWGVTGIGSRVCESCLGTGESIPEAGPEIQSEIEAIISRRPVADVSLDQAHLTPGCLHRKALFLISNGLVLGKDLLFLGDDDFLSLTVAREVESMLGREALARTEIHVIDLDIRIVSAVEKAATEWALPISASQGDAREPLPETLKGTFDCVVTDPPYTPKALGEFLKRCAEALNPASHPGRVVLSFGWKPPLERMFLFEAFQGLRLVPDQWLPGFNEYSGAAILANRSDLYLLSHVRGKKRSGTATEGFYTSERRKTVRKFRCTACGQSVRVGPGGDYPRIEDLKRSGCPYCANTRFRYAARER